MTMRKKQSDGTKKSEKRNKSTLEATTCGVRKEKRK